MKPIMGMELSQKIFKCLYTFFSKDLKNVRRDWDKVTNYSKRFGILNQDFVPNYANEVLTWELERLSADPTGDQKQMCELQTKVAAEGEFRWIHISAHTKSRHICMTVSMPTKMWDKHFLGIARLEEHIHLFQPHN